MPFALVRSSAALARSTDTTGVTGIAVGKCADCAHHRQFSEHWPDLALMIVQKLKTREAQVTVTFVTVVITRLDISVLN